MSDIKARLDKVRALIQEPEFLEGKGLSASARVAERQKRMASESAKISKQANEEAAQTLNRIYKMKKINK